MPTKPKTHKPPGAQNRTQRQRTYDKARYHKHKFYARRDWIALSKQVLSEEPWCQECLRNGIRTPSKVADHIQPRSTHPELEMARGNLQGLCVACNTRKG